MILNGGRPLKGEIAEQLALEKGLITQQQYDLIRWCNHPSIPCAGWDLWGFMEAIGVEQEFLDEVIEIQKEMQCLSTAAT